MPLLRGAFGIDAQPDALSRLLGTRAEAFELGRRVKHDMIRIAQQLRKVLLAVRSTEHMHLFVGHLLRAKSRFKQTACLRARERLGQERIKIIVGKRLLRKQDLAAGFPHHRGKQLGVFPQLCLLNDVGRGRQCAKRHFPLQTAERWTGVELALHQSTKTGA